MHCKRPYVASYAYAYATNRWVQGDFFLPVARRCHLFCSSDLLLLARALLSDWIEILYHR
jgi:hypothetical protein